MQGARQRLRVVKDLLPFAAIAAIAAIAPSPPSGCPPGRPPGGPDIPGMVPATPGAMTDPSIRRTLRPILAIAALVLLASGCNRPESDTGDPTDASTPLPPPPAPAGAASSMTDTVPLESLIMWDAPGAQTALASDGLQPRIISAELTYAGLRNGLALAAGGAEVHLFFFGDIGAADAAYRGLDAKSVRPLQATDGAPSAAINNNMLVIMFGDVATRRRIEQALTPGSEDRAADQVEP